jgi:hypothetical protein
MGTRILFEASQRVVRKNFVGSGQLHSYSYFPSFIKTCKTIRGSPVRPKKLCTLHQDRKRIYCLLKREY